MDVTRDSQKASSKVAGLTAAQRETLLAIARQSIAAALEGKEPPEFGVEDPVLKEERGCFVTLTQNGALRGCIGFIQAMEPLWQTVSKMARKAALNDPRFCPLGVEELNETRIEVSVLSPMRIISGASEIEVGVHGLWLTRGGFSGLLLPQVASEHDWDSQTFLEQTCVKAGLPPNGWREGCEIRSFSAEIFSEPGD